MTALSGGWSVPAVCGSFPLLSIGSNPSKKVTGFNARQVCGIVRIFSRTGLKAWVEGAHFRK
jgi:hypothetical protein